MSSSTAATRAISAADRGNSFDLLTDGGTGKRAGGCGPRAVMTPERLRLTVSERPTIAITMGDPGGIGPEVIVKALNDEALRARARFLVLGLGSSLSRAAREAGVAPYWDSGAPMSRWDAGPGALRLDDELGRRATPHGRFAPDVSAVRGTPSLTW